MRKLIGFIGRVFSGLRFRLLLLVVLACAPLVALLLHVAGEDRRRARANWSQRAQRLLQVDRREEEELLGGTRQLLLVIAESPPVRALDAARCQEWLAQLAAAYPRYANLGVLATNGQVLASARPRTEPGFQAGQFFRRALEARAFALEVIPSPSTNGPRRLRFGYPVFDPAGQVQAVVFAELNWHWVQRLGSELPARLPKGATWSEIDEQGLLLARYPGPERWLGRSLPEPALRPPLRRHPQGELAAPDSQGIPHFYAFDSRHSALADGTVTGILGIPQRELFAEADRRLRSNLTWLGLAAGLALGLGWVGSQYLILRPVKALVKSAARLAAGDLSARAGSRPARDELHQLTLAFDQMAQALEQRQGEWQRASRKLEALSYRLVEAQESERRHLARELHDEIGQSLTVAEMNLQAAVQSPNVTLLRRRLADSIQAVEHVQEQVHDLSLNLRPSMLDDLGLEPTLRWFTHRQAALTGLAAEFRAEPLEGRLEPIIETECFRVAQEALTNVVRHARAHALTVELSRRDGRLHLSVRDDGIGFDVLTSRDGAVRGTSLGLLSMEERASLAGGGLELNSAPGQGTEVHAWFPLRWQVAAEALVCE